MSAIRFSAQIGPGRTFRVPDEIADRFRSEQTVEIIILLPDPETEEDQDWTRMAADQMLRGYSNEDSIYDEIDLSAR